MVNIFLIKNNYFQEIPRFTTSLIFENSIFLFFFYLYLIIFNDMRGLFRAIPWFIIAIALWYTFLIRNLAMEEVQHTTCKYIFDSGLLRQPEWMTNENNVCLKNSITPVRSYDSEHFKFFVRIERSIERMSEFTKRHKIPSYMNFYLMNFWTWPHTITFDF